MILGHGGEIYDLAKKLNISPIEIKDFSTNISHYPLPSTFWDDLISSLPKIRLLPEVDNSELIHSFSKKYNLSPLNILAGNGTTEFIYLIPRILGSKSIVILNPTYSDYRDAASAEGINIIEIGAFIEKEDYKSFFENDIKRLQKNDIIFFCNPNNPTGHFISRDYLLNTVKENPDLLWVIDESYAPFVDNDPNSSLIFSDLPSNLMILRSFSKIYGLPGIRLGFLVAHKNITDHCRSYMQPWNINSFTQTAGLLIMKYCDSFFDESVRFFYHNEKAFFLEEIRKFLCFDVIPGDTHYILFKTDKTVDTKLLIEKLKEKGILIRLCDNFKGLDQSYLRIGLRNRSDNMLLLSELNAILSISE
jgi:threonine-phosphate decarboxylase